MFSRSLALLSTFFVVFESILYAFAHSLHAFRGIPRAHPPFRDIYTLTINALCDRPVFNFFTEGSCSAAFYGVSEGSFDYPILPFLLSRALPRYIFSSPDLLALSFIIVFLALLYGIYLLTKRTGLVTLTYILLVFSFPLRYLLERGQLDILTWMLVLLSSLSGFFFCCAPGSSHLAFDCSAKEKKLFLYLGNCFVPFFVLLSIAFKAFTILEAFVLPLVLLKFNLRTACFIAISLVPLSILSIYNPDGVGSVANQIQQMPGEIFGLSVGSSILSSGHSLLFRLAVVILSFLISSLFIGHHKHYPPSLLPPYILMSSSASAFIACYFLTSSANYKLFSVPLFLLSICWLYESSGTAGLKLFSFSGLLYLFGLCLPVIFFNYRPYIPSLQFLSQEFFDLFVMPALAGAMISYLFVPLFPLRVLGRLSLNAR